MPVELNHTIVPARDPLVSARFLADILGLPVDPPVAHFTPVTLTNGVTLDFDHNEHVHEHHYAFLLGEREWEAAFGRIKDAAIAADGGAAITVTGDVTDFGQVEAVRHQVEDALGPVGILVANAGGSLTPPALLEEIPEDWWRATVDANLLATFLTLKSFLPGMKERRKGSIITISSTAGRRPHPRSPVPYAAAKAGIALLTQDVAAQAGPFGIRANCIAPETILTEGNRERIPDEMQSAMADSHPLKRLGTPQDVADAAAYLPSDEAAWVTGVVLDVAGGAVMV